MGGRGTEREVSLSSGRTICDHLDISRYEIIPLFQRADGALFLMPWGFLHRGKTTDFEHRLETEAEKITWDSLKERIDFMYTAMHGRYAEDGTLQGFLELLQIPYLGSKVYASALGMDKIMQKKILAAHGITVPQGMVVTPPMLNNVSNDLLNAVKDLGYPCVIKPHKEGSSMGVSVANSQEELIPALTAASKIDGHSDQAVLIEEYITGMEFSCITISDAQNGGFIPLTPTEIVLDPTKQFFDYEQKYMPGKSTKFTPARCSDRDLTKIRETAVKVTQALGFRTLSRIDGFLKADGAVVITDPNSLAGMAPSSFIFRQAAEQGMSHRVFINHLIETELHAYGMHRSMTDAREKTMQAPQKKVGILLGGRNHEREVSLDSGRNVFYKLSHEKYEPIALFVSESLELYQIDQALLVRNSTKEIARDLTPSMKLLWNDLPQLVDFVFIGLHGDVGENGTIQGTLEMLGLPYNGSSVLTSALCMDKYMTGQFLATEGFDVPLQYLVEKEQFKAHKETELNRLQEFFGSRSLIVKPHDDGCSVMVAQADTQHELDHSISIIFADGKSHALVEERLKGMELTVGVMGNSTPQALPPSQTVTSKAILSMEEKFLPGAGENQTPAPVPSLAQAFIKSTLEGVYRSLNCRGYVRIDCFYQTPQESPTGEQRLVILEINTLPALTPATCIFHQAAEIGLKPTDFLDIIVQLGFEEHCRRGIVAATDTLPHSPVTSMTMNPPALENI